LIPVFIATGWNAMSIAVDPPARQTEIIVPYVEYEWWLMRWATNTYECPIIVDHEGLPTSDDIYVFCGSTLYNEWLETVACNPALEGSDTSSCTGLYLHKVASETKEKTLIVDLPLPEAWISISGCSPVPPENRCETLPNLLITGEEPLPNEDIIQIQGTYNEIPFLCEGDRCEIPLRPTLEEGIEITFWADSSFGDSSPQYKAQVRVTDGGVSVSPGSGGWIIDVMSNRWQGYQAQGCGPIWGSFPPIGGPPTWLASPDWSELLATDDPYMYLAGRLISKGIVNASECPGGGLEYNGYANACGLEKARPEVDTWQNSFDAQIVTVAQETGVPSQLMKNLFAKESQFWPGAFNDAEEFGLGQLTELGADTVLLWNSTFYYQFCPLVLSNETCNLGYALMPEEDQAILRGALTSQANSDCLDCQANIDLNQAIFSIDLFAQTIIANCQQVGQIVTNISGESPGFVSSYEDLWRFTLANYHAGPGCLTNAMNASRGRPLTWENIAPELETECPGTQAYIESIAK
jgi:hypothetical protein